MVRFGAMWHFHGFNELLQTAVHYTHATATFAATFLLRLARLLYVYTPIYNT